MTSGQSWHGSRGTFVHALERNLIKQVPDQRDLSLGKGSFALRTIGRFVVVRQVVGHFEQIILPRGLSWHSNSQGCRYWLGLRRIHDSMQIRQKEEKHRSCEQATGFHKMLRQIGQSRKSMFTGEWTRSEHGIPPMVSISSGSSCYIG